MDDFTIRPATASEIPAIVRLLADDPLGAARESPHDLATYYRAFEAIQHDLNCLLAVLEQAGAVVGTLQLSFMPGLSHQGARRCEVEAVRIAAHKRGYGLGTALIRWAIAEARAHGCRIVQLTSDDSRVDAHRFYQRLGFAGSHRGFQLEL